MPQAKQQQSYGPARKVAVIRVIDGDTVVVQEKGGILTGKGQERIRLWGIDAPESSQTGGNEATDHLKRLIGRRRDIYLTRVVKDQYGRTVGIIHPESGTIDNAYNYGMVRDGHAHCYMLSGAQTARYKNAERVAKQNKLGMWRRNKIKHPSQYRKEEKAKAKWAPVKFLIYAALLGAAAYMVLKIGERLSG